MCFAIVIYGWVVFWEVFQCLVTTNCNILWSECVTETVKSHSYAMLHQPCGLFV